MKVTIAKHSPRHKLWLDVFGTDTLDVLSPQTERRDGPDGEKLFYRINVRALTLAQRTRAIRYLSRRWKLPIDEVAKSLDDPKHGLPIDAADVTLGPMDLRLFV
jgi:hypothetical protein